MAAETGRLEAMAAELEASGDYRVLRRLPTRAAYREPDGTPIKVAIALDVEATGLDHTHDEIIELAMVKFEFAPDGRIFRLLGEFRGFNQPSRPIPPEIVKLTGITDEMVAGQSIDPLEVAGFVDSASVIVAHNAAFDRKFAERVWDCFATKAWACSATEVDWKVEGHDGTRLGYLLNGCGLFHDGHRAVDDCRALVEILSRPLPASGEIALKRLLDEARKAKVRIWAENSPYDLKDELKARGYRWNDGGDGRPRSWWRDVAEAEVEAEVAWLRATVYRRDITPLMRRLTAFDRFSERA